MPVSPRSIAVTGLTTALIMLTACNQSGPVQPAELTAPIAALTCFRENTASMLAAHRGGPAPGYPENSLSGLQRLSRLGVLYAEIDVRRSADGVLYLLHDDTLDRTTTGAGPTAGQNWADLSTHLLQDNQGQRSDETIPTLIEAIELARTNGLILNLDLKSVPPAEIVRFVHDNTARDHVAIIAYSVDAAAAIHALDPGLLLSVPHDIDRLASAGVNLEASYVWLGTGQIDANADADLATRGIETSAGLFRREDGTSRPYLDAVSAGVELISIDNVDAAVSALGGPEELERQIEACST